MRADWLPSEASATYVITPAPSFGPEMLSGLRMWLRSDVGVETTGGKVTRWRDQSPNGHDAVQASSAAEPTLTSDAARGFPVMRFDGNDYMPLTSLITTGRTVVMALRNSSGGGYCAPLGTTTGNTYTSGWGRQIWHSSWDPASVVNGETWLNGVAVDGMVRMYPAANEGLAVLTSIATAAVPTEHVGAGFGGGSSPGNFWQGDIAEVLIYDRALSGMERHQVEEYLMRKYGSVPNLAPSPPTASPNGGLFTGSVEVSLTTTTPGATVYYTLDGSEPTPAQGQLYAGPLTLTATTIVRAKAYLGELTSATSAFQFYDSALFNPTDVAGLQLWLRADAVDRAIGFVDLWRDQSGNGNDASQTSGTRLPQLATDSVSGLPVVRFDGNDYMPLTSLITTGRTVVMALRNSSGGGYCAPLGTTTGNTYTSDWGRQIWHSTWDPASVVSGETWLNGEGVDGKVRQYPAANAGLAVLTSTATSAVPTEHVGAGFGGGSSPGNFWQGDIAEVLIYDRALTWTERLYVEHYLGVKYRLDPWIHGEDGDSDGITDEEEPNRGCDAHLADTNGDGIYDGAAIAAGLSCSDPDMDQDGVANTVELAQGTNPFDPDTDGDGVGDGADCAPVDASKACPVPVPGDATPPAIDLVEPTNAVLVSSI